MALDHAKAFIRKLSEDTRFQQEFNDFAAAHREAAKQQIIRMGESAGFEFTTSELQEAFQQQFGKYNELSEQDLRSVVGGETGVIRFVNTSYKTCF